MEIKLSRVPKKSKGKHHNNARKRDAEVRKERKKRYNKKNRTRNVEFKEGDWA